MTSRLVQAYRRISPIGAFLISAVISWVGVVIAATLGAFGFVYLYDRGQSKGTDFAVLLIGAHALGTLAMITMFTWLWKLHHKPFSRTPELLLAVCLLGTAIDTHIFWNSDYSDFVWVGWVLILGFGFLGLFLSKRMLRVPSPD